MIFFFKLPDPFVLVRAIISCTPSVLHAADHRCRVAGRLVSVLLSAATLLISPGFCSGNTMSLTSNANETLNSSSNPTMTVIPDSRWAAAFPGSSWISSVNSGDINGSSFVGLENGTSVTFTDTFLVEGSPTSGILKVLADDSASVSLNGSLLMPFASNAGNTYELCSDFPIGCLAKSEAAIHLSALHPGLNTLSFEVFQLNGESFGLDYLARITYDPAPESSTIFLSALFLVALLAKETDFPECASISTSRKDEV